MFCIQNVYLLCNAISSFLLVDLLKILCDILMTVGIPADVLTEVRLCSHWARWNVGVCVFSRRVVFNLALVFRLSIQLVKLSVETRLIKLFSPWSMLLIIHQSKALHTLNIKWEYYQMTVPCNSIFSLSGMPSTMAYSVQSKTYKDLFKKIKWNYDLSNFRFSSAF